MKEIHGDLKQAYTFKWLLEPFLIGERVVGGRGCSIRNREENCLPGIFELGWRKKTIITGGERRLGLRVCRDRSERCTVQKCLKKVQGSFPAAIYFPSLDVVGTGAGANDGSRAAWSRRCWPVGHQCQWPGG